MIVILTSSITRYQLKNGIRKKNTMVMIIFKNVSSYWILIGKSQIQIVSQTLKRNKKNIIFYQFYYDTYLNDFFQRRTIACLKHFIVNSLIVFFADNLLSYICWVHSHINLVSVINGKKVFATTEICICYLLN